MEGLPAWYTGMRELIFFVTHIDSVQYDAWMPEFDDVWNHASDGSVDLARPGDYLWVNGQYQPTYDSMHLSVSLCISRSLSLSVSLCLPCLSAFLFLWRSLYLSLYVSLCVFSAVDLETSSWQQRKEQ